MPLHSLYCLYYGIAFLLSGYLACASSPQGQPTMSKAKLVTAIDKDNNSLVQLARNDSLAIRLVSQPGTGYGWMLAQHDTTHLEFLDEKPEFREEEDQLEGGAEYQIFRFVALKADSSVVVLHYVRPWKKNDPAKTYRLTVKEP
ncbi:MAG: hypothetical protein CMJ50_10165 [Planctomycetaceae bacterium]|nr:hypothetical protein [Planctomycetaceae bacterium]